MPLTLFSPWENTCCVDGRSCLVHPFCTLLNPAVATCILSGMDNWMYYSFTVLMKMWNHVGDPKAPASKVLVLTWGFLILILMHLYTAVSATIIHKRTPQLNISGLDQLQNARVLTAHKYVPIVQKDLNVTADGHSW
jgi:hypothetical protein